jgi:hypothetical protein
MDVVRRYCFHNDYATFIRYWVESVGLSIALTDTS